MLFKRMDYCEINRQREPAQVFNNYCESGPARGHCSCVAMASVAPVEYLDPSLPPLSSSPAPECSLSMFVAQGAGHGGAAGRESYRWPPPPRPAPPGTEDCLFSWRQNILVRQSGSGAGTRDGGDSTGTGCGWRGRDTNT